MIPFPLENLGWARMEELQRTAASPRHEGPAELEPAALAEVHRLEAGGKTSHACCQARTA